MKVRPSVKKCAINVKSLDARVLFALFAKIQNTSKDKDKLWLVSQVWIYQRKKG